MKLRSSITSGIFPPVPSKGKFPKSSSISDRVALTRDDSRRRENYLLRDGPRSLLPFPLLIDFLLPTSRRSNR